MTTASEAQHLVEDYWAGMNTNDWAAVAAQLHPDYLLTYPQSGERFRGTAAISSRC